MPATPSWPPRSSPRLFVPPPLVEGGEQVLSGSAAHYLARVMRVKPGDAVILCDNVSGEWAAEVAASGKREVVLTVRQQLKGREPVPDFWLCAALLKKDRFDLVLEKATELGAARIVPVLTRRCVADKLNLERAGAHIVEAAEQCARTALPELSPPQKLGALLRDWPKERRLLFADEQGGVPAAQAMRDAGAPAALLIGPEGGFDDEERARIRAEAASQAISLGPRILRAETAAIAGMALWMGEAGDWG